MATLFDLKEFQPYRKQWSARVSEMMRRKKYYDGTIYNAGLLNLGWMKQAFDRQVKPLYLPLSRAVDIDVGIVPAGWKLADDIIERYNDAIQRDFTWSEWATDGGLLVLYGAVYGGCGIKVSDLRDEK